MDELYKKLPIKSLHSRQKIHIRIVNLSARDADIIWINFLGQYVRYIRLQHEDFVDIDTYETHPWIAVDSETKDRLLLGNRFIYTAIPLREAIRHLHASLPSESHSENFKLRLTVKITLPVYSLRYRALLEMRRYLRSSADVDNLDLPKQLLDDLKYLMLEQTSYPRA